MSERELVTDFREP